MDKVAIIFIIIALPMLFAFMVVDISASQGTCPDGNGWVKVENSEFVPVEGAIEYCFKAGSESSQGCDGGIFDTWPLPEGACGLSHWSYKMGEPTPTATVATSTPTETFTQTPESTATFTQEPSVTPEEPTPTRTPCYPLHCGNG